MASITVDGVQIIIENGKARLSAQSWQRANASMWRSGSSQARSASSYSAKANRIINSLNSTGSYANSAGMRTYINKGTIRQQADRGTEAYRVQQRIASMGGLEPQPISVEDEMAEEKAERMAEKVENIGDDIAQKAQKYFDKISETTSKIEQSIVDVFTD